MKEILAECQFFNAENRLPEELDDNLVAVYVRLMTETHSSLPSPRQASQNLLERELLDSPSFRLSEMNSVKSSLIPISLLVFLHRGCLHICVLLAMYCHMGEPHVCRFMVSGASANHAVHVFRLKMTSLSDQRALLHAKSG